MPLLYSLVNREAEKWGNAAALDIWGAVTTSALEHPQSFRRSVGSLDTRLYSVFVGLHSHSMLLEMLP